MNPHRAPGQLAKIAPPAPWWRLAWAWARGINRRLADRREQLRDARLRATFDSPLPRRRSRLPGVEPTWYPPPPERGP